MAAGGCVALNTNTRPPVFSDSSGFSKIFFENLLLGTENLELGTEILLDSQRFFGILSHGRRWQRCRTKDSAL